MASQPGLRSRARAGSNASTGSYNTFSRSGNLPILKSRSSNQLTDTFGEDKLGFQIDMLKREIYAVDQYLEFEGVEIDDLKRRLLKDYRDQCDNLLTDMTEFYNTLQSVSPSALNRSSNNMYPVYETICKILGKLVKNMRKLRSDDIVDYIAYVHEKISSQRYWEKFWRKTRNLLVQISPLLTTGAYAGIVVGILGLSSLAFLGVGIGIFALTAAAVHFYNKSQSPDPNGRTLSDDPYKWSSVDLYEYSVCFYRKLAQKIHMNNVELNILNTCQEYLHEYVNMFMDMPIEINKRRSLPIRMAILEQFSIMRRTDDPELFQASIKRVVAYVNITILKLTQLVRSNSNPLEFLIEGVQGRVLCGDRGTPHWTDDIFAILVKVGELKQTNGLNILESTLYQATCNRAFSPTDFSQTKFKNRIRKLYPEVMEQELNMAAKRYEIYDFIEDQAKRVFNNMGLKLECQLDPAIDIMSSIEDATPCRKISYWVSSIKYCRYLLENLNAKTVTPIDISPDDYFACIQYMMLKSTVSNWCVNIKIMHLFYLTAEDAKQVVELDNDEELYPISDYVTYPTIERDGTELEANIDICISIMQNLIETEIPDDYEMLNDDLETIDLESDGPIDVPNPVFTGFSFSNTGHDSTVQKKLDDYIGNLDENLNNIGVRLRETRNVSSDSSLPTSVCSSPVGPSQVMDDDAVLAERIKRFQKKINPGITIMEYDLANSGYSDIQISRVL